MRNASPVSKQMDPISPLWVGIGGTLLAALVFLNALRLLDKDMSKRKMGLFHLVLSPIFVAMLWAILIGKNLV